MPHALNLPTVPLSQQPKHTSNIKVNHLQRISSADSVTQSQTKNARTTSFPKQFGPSPSSTPYPGTHLLKPFYTSPDDAEKHISRSRIDSGPLTNTKHNELNAAMTAVAPGAHDPKKISNMCFNVNMTTTNGQSLQQQPNSARNSAPTICPPQ